MTLCDGLLRKNLPQFCREQAVECVCLRRAALLAVAGARVREGEDVVEGEAEFLEAARRQLDAIRARAEAMGQLMLARLVDIAKQEADDELGTIARPGARPQHLKN